MDRLHISIDNRYETEARVRRVIGCSLGDLVRTLVRMWLAGEIVVTKEDVTRHQGGRAEAEGS